MFSPMIEPTKPPNITSGAASFSAALAYQYASKEVTNVAVEIIVFSFMYL